ncbi:MAG: nucleotide exchange factor GrpE [Bauldia sp.]
MSDENQEKSKDRPETETIDEPEILSPETEPANDAGPVAPLLAEIADLKDRLLRAAAEMENIRRRHEREMADARQYALTGFARDLLPVGDNLARALDAVSPEARAEASVAGLFSGVEMTDREFQRVLEKHHVRRFDPKGGKFDPHKEQAMYEVEDGSVDAGTVVQVVQPGYMIGERVLRPALVGVSKAPAKTEAKSAEEEKPEPAEVVAEAKPGEEPVKPAEGEAAAKTEDVPAADAAAEPSSGS